MSDVSAVLSATSPMHAPERATHQRLTTAQALIRYLASRQVKCTDLILPSDLAADPDPGAGSLPGKPTGTPARAASGRENEGATLPLFGGMWAIFGHGNVAGLGEALYAERERLPTFRAHNEQGMAHAAIGYAKAHFRRRMMAVTTSIGPGATNLVTAAALAHVNRLPLLLLPGDIFVSRDPDPVLQQLEHPGDGTCSVNDCLKPVSRYFDRITHPAQLLSALPRAIATLTDPAQCGPVTLALPQDVQAMAYDYPASFFETACVAFRAPVPEEEQLEQALALLRAAKRPLLIAGGGVLYSAGGPAALRRFAEQHGVPVTETQAGKSALPWDHPLQLGAIGVTGSPAANALAAEADVILAVGTRLSDFTSGSHALFPQARVLGINVNTFDADKAGPRGCAVQGDAARVLEALSVRWADSCGATVTTSAWRAEAETQAQQWRIQVQGITRAPLAPGQLPYEGEVIGVVQQHADSPHDDIVVCAAGTLPAELHKLWRSARPGGYHLDYGYSCMGYEIAGAVGVKLARPEREVVVMVGDGSYLMMNSELASAAQLGLKLIVVLLDNRGYGCIHRLQQACGGAPFNNLLRDCTGQPPVIDFAQHARALGIQGVAVPNLAELERALQTARAHPGSTLIWIETDPLRTTTEGGAWWEVAVPEVSTRPAVQAARKNYEQKRAERQQEKGKAL